MAGCRYSGGHGSSKATYEEIKTMKMVSVTNITETLNEHVVENGITLKQTG